MTYLFVSEVPEKFDNEYTLKECNETEHDDGTKTWMFSCDGVGFGVGADKFTNQLDLPEPGAKIQVLGAWGQTIRGVGIDGKLLFYRTKEEAEQDHKDWVKQYDADNMKKFIEGKSEADKDIEALPVEFQKRFYGYHKAGGNDWRAKFEPYELFACKQAMALVENFDKDPAKIRAWTKMSTEDQYKAFPAMDDDHSGGTYGHMVKMALAYLEEPGAVDKLPSGMSQIVGSEEAKDWVTRPENAEELKKMRAEEAAKKDEAEHLHEP